MYIKETDYLDNSSLIWFRRMRWVALFGQSFAILLFSYFFSFHFDTAIITAVFVLTFISNIVLHSVKEVRRRFIALILLFDITCLSVLLYLCGGASNPFSIVYLLHVALAAVILGRVWTWCMTIITSFYFALLFFYYHPLPHELQHNHGGGFSAHLQGMWLAYVLVAALLAYFLTKIIGTVKARENYIEVLRNKQEKLAALTTLAAGAAHELSTPLATIALIAKDLEKNISLLSDDQDLKEDLRIMQCELLRCKKIIQEMSGNTEQSMAEIPQEYSIQQIKMALAEKLMMSETEVVISDLTNNPKITIAKDGFIHTLLNLIKNALAANSNEKIQVQISSSDNEVLFKVIDKGAGISADELVRVGEPFYTTKEPGQGMGLGVFLARTFSERFGGSLRLESEPGIGTQAILSLPIK